MSEGRGRVRPDPRVPPAGDSKVPRGGLVGRRPSVLREILLFVLISCACLLAFAYALTRRVDRQAEEALALTRTFQQTTELELDMRVALRQELDLLRSQFERIDAEFPIQLARINFLLGRLENRYLEIDVGVEERQTVGRISELLSASGNLALISHTQLEAGERERALVSRQEVEDLGRRAGEELDRLGQLQLAGLAAAIEAIQRSSDQSQTTLPMLAVGVLLLPLVLLALLRRWFLAPIAGLTEAASRLREGDFAARAPVVRPDELGQLAEDFNFMADELARDHVELETRFAQRGSELESLQRQLQRTASRTAMGQLVSGVAHELNNPLTVIMGISQLLADREEVSDEQRRDLETVLHQAERCQRIVAQLAEYARPPKLERVEVDLGELCRGILAANPFLQDPAVTVVVDQVDEARLVFADPFRLEQVVVNLLRNAFEAVASRAGAGRVELRIAADRDVVSLMVEDDGPGLDDPERAFDPFYSTKATGEGMGMGLAVSHRIVEEHDGEIQAENLEVGARLTVRLPRVRQARAEGEEEPRSVPSLKGREAMVLVVEDEIPLLELQTQFLSQRGLEVRQALTIEEAIAVLRREQVDLVVADFKIPGRLSGLDLYRWIQVHRSDLVERFVLITADIVGIQHYREKLTMPYLEKPFTWTAYERVLGGALNRPLGAEVEA